MGKNSQRFYLLCTIPNKQAHSFNPNCSLSSILK